MITSAPLNRVVYEGATNTTMACEGTYTFRGWSEWGLFPFTFPGQSGLIVISPMAPYGPPFPDTFAIEHSPDGTESLVLFNATISPSIGASLATPRMYNIIYPSTGASFSRAGIYVCADIEEVRLAHLVVIPKYELP